MSNFKKWLPRVLAALVAVLLLFGSILIATDRKTAATLQKTIYVTVEPQNGEPMSYKMDTTADTLKNALLTDGFMTGVTTDNGFIVQTIGGTSAGDNWHWRLIVNDKATGKTVDRIALHHNDRFTFKSVADQQE